MAFVVCDFETYYEIRKPANIPSTKDGGRTRFSLRDRSYEQYICDPDLFQVHCVSLQIDNDEPYCVWGEDAVRAELERIFYPGNEHTFCAQNALFDAAILSWHFGLRAARYQCTMMMSLALWPHAKAGLKHIAKRLFPDDETLRKGGEELVDVAGLRTEEIDEAKRGPLMRYANQDTRLTFNIYAQMWKAIPNDELDLIDWTVRIFAHPPFDLDRNLLIRYLEEAEAEQTRLIEQSGLPKSTLTSNKKFAEWLESEKQIEVTLKASPTPNNPDNVTWALAKKDLAFIDLQRQHPELEHIWKAKIACGSTIHISRARRMLEHHALHPQNRMALALVANAAHTKRWGGTNNINPQNFPNGGAHRLSIRAPDGYTLVIRDYSNIEGRVNAWNAGEDWKCKAFAEGRDLYNELASNIYGRPIDRKRVEIDPVTGEKTYPDAAPGFVGKTAELGLGYQSGAVTLRLALATNDRMRILISPDEAEHIKRTWREMNPAIVDYWNICQHRIIWDLANRNLEPYEFGPLRVEPFRLVLPSGLALTYPKLRLNDHNDPRSGFSYWNGKYMVNLYGGKLTENIVQALARCILSEHLLIIDQWLRDTFPGTEAQVGLTVHDEMISIVPKEGAQEANDFMTRTMSVCPDWCNDGALVLASEGDISENYSK